MNAFEARNIRALHGLALYDSAKYKVLKASGRRTDIGARVVWRLNCEYCHINPADRCSTAKHLHIIRAATMRCIYQMSKLRVN